MLFNHLDKNSRAREAKRVMGYMKREGLIRGDYQHGLQITDKGRKRLSGKKHKIVIARPTVWDMKWRIVLYDIPEEYKVGRNALTSQLKEFGFSQLQRSVWIFPYECREAVNVTAARYGIDRFVSFLVTEHLDNQKILVEKFKLNGIL